MERRKFGLVPGASSRPDVMPCSDRKRQASLWRGSVETARGLQALVAPCLESCQPVAQLFGRQLVALACLGRGKLASDEAIDDIALYAHAVAGVGACEFVRPSAHATSLSRELLALYLATAMELHFLQPLLPPWFFLMYVFSSENS
jgi:hypothetical protein